MSHVETNGRFSTNGKPKAEVAWDDEIPSDGPELFVLRMKANKCLTFTSWATAIKGVWYHWVKGSSEPHIKDETRCPGCRGMQPKKWKGYLHVYCSEMRQEVFLELTPTAAKSLREQCNHVASMRGVCFQLKRSGSDNGRLYVHIMNPCANADGLPKEKDPRPSLLKLWGLTQDQIDAWMHDPHEPGEGGQFT